MSSTRQKSCYACIQSKRRCEGRPKCRRCQARKLSCVFATLPVNTSSEEATGYIEQHGGALTDETLGDWQLQHRNRSGLAIPSPDMSEAFFEFVNDPFNLPSLPRDNSIASPAVGDIAVHQPLTDIEHASRNADTQRTVEYITARLKEIPKCFTEHAQTTFIHRTLFQTNPAPPLQDALSVGALYHFRNDATYNLAILTLEHKARQLIATTNIGEATRSDMLAATQALLIYQIIRLFDGNIRLRAQAEVDEWTLTSWADVLKSGMQQLEPPSPTAGVTPHDSLHLSTDDTTARWYNWLFEECVRRTVIYEMIVKGTYYFLKYGHYTDYDSWLSFTAQKKLWEAQSQYSWSIARKELNMLEVRLLHWEEDVANANPGDLEELGVQIMALFRGLDGTAQWIGKDLLVLYGLDKVV